MNRATPARILAPFLALLLALFALPGVAQDLREAELRNSIVIINGYDNREIKQTGSGFVAQSDQGMGYVVTNARLVEGVGSLMVIAPVSGAELPAQVVHTDPEFNLALLRVAGLEGRPLVLAADASAASDVVWSAIKWPSENGSLGLTQGKLLGSDSTGSALLHTANIGGVMGSVLLNDCGQALGLNVESAARTRAINASTLEALLRPFNINVSKASKPCVPFSVQAQQQVELATAEAERATSEAERALQAAQDLEQRLSASSERNAKLEAEARAARNRADEAIAAAEQARQNAEDTRVELERRTATIQAETEAMVKLMERDREAAERRFQEALAQQKAEAASRERILLIAAGILLLVSAVVIFFLLRRNVGDAPRVTGSTSAAEPAGKSNTEMHKEQRLTEYVLDGRDEDGIRYLLRISGDQLTNPDGVVIGRNPQDSPYIINHADVSRKHARMKVMKNRVFIEDLGSTNGTSVNGQSIDDKGPVSIDNGDQIIIGSVVMKLRVLGA